MDKRDGIYDESKDRLSPDFDALLRKAGSAGYQNQEMPECMECFEYNILSSHLAPYESDGPGDSEEWNLFAAYLDKTPEALGKPHILSTMLQHWENDLVSQIQGPVYEQTLIAIKGPCWEKGTGTRRGPA